MKTALDSNILSALWSAEPTTARIMAELNESRSQGAIVVCAPVYAELLAHPAVSSDFVGRFLADTRITVEFDLDEPVWRKAADTFAAYARRRRQSAGDSPKRFLADFIIAAHALLRADRLLTLDPTRYRQYFPTLRLA